jgi:hypothetical protein
MKLIILLLATGKVHSLGIPALTANCSSGVIHLASVCIAGGETRRLKRQFFPGDQFGNQFFPNQGNPWLNQGNQGNQVNPWGNQGEYRESN